jgi:hypothetical protein
MRTGHPHRTTGTGPGGTTGTGPGGTIGRRSSRLLRIAALGAVTSWLVLGLGAEAGAHLASSAHTSAVSAATGSKTVWLCRPGQADDPCTASLTATSVNATDDTAVQRATVRSSSKFDCFYVYPTVSEQKTNNANLKVQAAEIDAARLQASRFSQVCRVWAPMYRQLTVPALARGSAANKAVGLIAYNSLLSGWKDYVAHDNHGRPVIFIGHSQGAAMLINLLQRQIDPNAALRRRMVSAIILGGNVQVPTGKVVGGSFKHIPTCTSVRQTGCVIAYSTFATTPPADSMFGRPGQGVSVQSLQTATTGQQVACVNPTNFSTATGALRPYFLSAGTNVPGVTLSTPWVTFPNLYTATCMSSGGATWLQVTADPDASDTRPKVAAVLGPTWGLHLDDVNLALGNLVLDVGLEEASYR